MADTSTYDAQRARLELYFDRTATQAWERLTSDAPVSRIRETVRQGRAEMRATLLGWMPADLTGARVLDAGCGTGALAVEAARRGAHVVAVDVAPRLVAIAVARTPAGRFDFAVAMDSLIHYRAGDIADAVAGLAERCDRAVLTTFAPRTALLALMHATGKLFPRGDRSPAIQPVAERALRRRIEAQGCATARTARVARGFYISQALEVAGAGTTRSRAAERGDGTA